MLDITSFRKASLLTLIFILLGWTLNSAIMSQVLHSGTFIEQFIQPDAHHLWMRIPPAVLTIVLVFLTRYFVIKQNKIIVKFNENLSEIKALSGLLPICAWCKKIRDDTGYWDEVEHYISKHSDAEFTHGMCAECLEKYLKENEVS